MLIPKPKLVAAAAFFVSALLTLALREWLLLLALLWGIYFMGGLAAFRKNPTMRVANLAIAAGLSLGLWLLIWGPLRQV